MAHTITLYAKAGCHLCDEAREHLEQLLEQFVARHRADAVTLDEVDIRRDDALFERYRYRIPVITVDGRERLEGRIAADEIARLLDEE